MILTISTAFGLLATDTLIHINAPPIPSKSSWYTNRCRDDPAHKDNLHIPTSALGIRRLSSNNFLRPDSSPFYCFSKNDSNGSRLACLGNRRFYSKIKPPIFQIYPWILGIKKERLSIPDTGANRRSMYMVVFNFISYNVLALGTSAFWISKVFSTFFRLISWKRIFISKNGPFSAND